MKTYIFNGAVTALSSISHIGENRGITSLLRREKIVAGDGTVEEVPIFSGNGIRGMLRDRGMLHMCRSIGYGEPDENGVPCGLSLAAFYFLFSGGSLVGNKEKSKPVSRGIDVDLARNMRSNIPLISIFGAAIGNQIMPGKLKCGKLIPLCAETAHIVPKSLSSNCNASIWDMVQRESYARRDDEKNDNLRGLIEPEARKRLETNAALKRAAIDEPDTDTGAHQQMRYSVETLASGTRFFWELCLDDVTDTEFEAFCITLAEFSRLPYIGGKSSIGHGKISVRFDNWMEIDPRLAPSGSAVSFTLGTQYLSHLNKNGENIRATLNQMV
jgi:hypothetical protein